MEKKIEAGAQSFQSRKFYFPESRKLKYENAEGEKVQESSERRTWEMFRNMAPMWNGIHFMPLGWSDILPEIIDKSGITRH
jgi:5,10-methylenetetrahydrofolate reductase